MSVRAITLVASSVIRSAANMDRKIRSAHAALRNDHNFPMGDTSKETPARVKFADVDRFECYESVSNPKREKRETNGRKNRYVRLAIDRSGDDRRGSGDQGTRAIPAGVMRRGSSPALSRKNKQIALPR